MIPPGYVPLVLNTEDIPIQRDSVGAMGLSSPALPEFKPYVYRGTGEDQIEAAAWRRAEAAREQAAHWERERKEAAQRERQRRQHLREKTKRREQRARAQRDVEAIPRLIAEMHAGIERALAQATKPKPRPTIPPLPRRPARSAPGWRPLTGSDLEDLWAALEDS